MSKELPSKQTRVLVDLTTDKERYLVGWPGYRNAPGRYGLGYVETKAELAHMYGWIICTMGNKKIITRNPIFLICMTIVAVICVMPLVLGIPDILNGGSAGWVVLFSFAPYWLIGLLLLQNVYLALTTNDVVEDKSTETPLDDGNSSAYNPSHQEE